jgi:TonB family protein
MCLVPHIAYAACSSKPYDENFPYSKAALEARDAFYVSLCDESFAELVMLPDPRLGDRVVSPSKRGPTGETPYAQKVAALGLDGTAVVAYVVESNGSVGHAIILESSGHEVLDEAALTRAKELHFGSPGTMDGLPVRVLLVNKVPFKFPKNSGAVSIPFSDEAIVSLGLRIIDYCNRGDVEGLYGDYDESARKQFSRADAKQQLQLYNGLYGQMVVAKYQGRMKSELTMDVPVFRLAAGFRVIGPP